VGDWLTARASLAHKIDYSVSRHSITAPDRLEVKAGERGVKVG